MAGQGSVTRRPSLSSGGARLSPLWPNYFLVARVQIRAAIQTTARKSSVEAMPWSSRTTANDPSHKPSAAITMSAPMAIAQTSAFVSFSVFTASPTKPTIHGLACARCSRKVDSRSREWCDRGPIGGAALLHLPRSRHAQHPGGVSDLRGSAGEVATLKRGAAIQYQAAPF
jgi:hypothetical protein